MAEDNPTYAGYGETTTSSPNNKFKFLCSHGGRILPRPADGRLKYVGGETRAISIPRDTTYKELMQRVSTSCNGDMVLKYQTMSQDLDALVSVRTDDDLRLMLEEYDRQGVESMPMLRVYLFPSKPILIENKGSSSSTIEQHYIDSVNGIIHSSTARNRPIFSISECSSPKSPSPDSISAYSKNPFGRDQRNGGLSMHRVRSSPVLSSLNDVNSNGIQTPRVARHRCRHHCHHYQKQHQCHVHQAHKPLHPHMSIGGERSVNASSMGRSSVGRNHMGYGLSPCSPSSPLTCYGGNRVSGRYANAYGYGRLDRGDSLPHTPVRGNW